jgi:hypothetical protein
MEIGWDERALVTRVAGDPRGDWLAAGLDDGRVWACHLASERVTPLKTEKGPPISALTVLGGAGQTPRAAWGDEAGGAGLAPVAPA